MIPDEWKLTNKERHLAYGSAETNPVEAVSDAAALKAARMALEWAAEIAQERVDMYKLSTGNDPHMKLAAAISMRDEIRAKLAELESDR